MKTRVTLVCLILGLGAGALPARDLAAYHLGDTVDADVVTPVALDVIDPAATATLKNTESTRVPAIYRDYAADTNAVTAAFDAAFESARTNFVAAVLDTYHTPTVDEKTATSDDFGYLITAFNVRNKDFPVTSTLAMDWAYGKPGNFEKKMLLGALLSAVRSPIRPDDLPSDFANLPDARLVAPNQQSARLQGPVVAQSALVTITQARMAFRKSFAGYDEEPLAHILCTWVKPNCIPDPAATEQARQEATARLVVAEHYNAGQVIASAGTIVDAKTLAAFDQLSGGRAAMVTQISESPSPAPVEMAAPAPAPRPVAVVSAPQSYTPVPASDGSDDLQLNNKSVPTPAHWLKTLGTSQGVLELASISAISLFIFVALFVRRMMKRKPRPSMGKIQPVNSGKAQRAQPASASATTPLAPASDVHARELLEQIHAQMRAQELAQLQAEGDANVHAVAETQARSQALLSQMPVPAPTANLPASSSNLPVSAPTSALANVEAQPPGAANRLSPATAIPIPMELQTALAPQLVLAVREALVQELAGQRRELLVVQHNAAVEVSRLVRRMDEMQIQLQERLKIYELQITRLESELAARTEENQELIKMKIQMIRSQRESEHAPDPAAQHAEMAFS